MACDTTVLFKHWRLHLTKHNHIDLEDGTWHNSIIWTLNMFFCVRAGGKKRSSFQRSEEVLPVVDLRGGMSKQASKDSTDGSIGSISSDSSSV